MNIDIVPCSVNNLEKLIEGKEAFRKAYKVQVVDGYMPFGGALQYILSQMQSLQIWHPWLPYQFIFRPDQALIGLGGFKAVPNSERIVEIGYSIAPSYQNRGFATSAVHQLVQIAFESNLVDCVCAHTLAEFNASTRVLTKCGMSKVSETDDPDVGKVWRWELTVRG
jgi:[ribosomal protein S5]-alanine N-acetyltransferase